ncbi:MAG: TenA family protein [Stackebrandtia sp.]
MNFTETLVNDEAWKAYRHHEWIERLADGTLRQEQFVFFHEFDTSFSADMHRTLAVGISKAPAGCDWARAATYILYDSFIADKQKSKAELLERIGAPRDVAIDRSRRGLSRDAYANHLLRVAWEHPIGVIAAALLPCAMFTNIIGERFADDPPASGPEIAAWARAYVNPRDMAITERHKEMMNSYADEAGRHGRAAMRHEFTRSVDYQIRVFDAALRTSDNFTGDD